MPSRAANTLLWTFWATSDTAQPYRSRMNRFTTMPSPSISTRMPLAVIFFPVT